MNRQVAVKIMPHTVEFPGRKDFLLAGKCSAVLPLNIIVEGSSCRGVYNTEGYRRISSMDNVPAWDILNLTQKCLECIELCKDWLIYPEEYVLSADTMYISDDMRMARLVYIPSERKESSSTAAARFIYSLKKIATENGRTYLDTVGKMMECSGLKYHRITAFIEELKHEVKLYEIT